MLLISLILFLTFPGFLVLVSQLNLKKQISSYRGFSCHMKSRLMTLKYFQTSLHAVFFAFEIKTDSLTKFLTGRVSKNWISAMTYFQMGKSSKCRRHQEGQVRQSSQTPAIPCWHYWDQGIWHELLTLNNKKTKQISYWNLSPLNYIVSHFVQCFCQMQVYFC